MLLPGEHVAASLAPGERKMIAFAGVEGSLLSADARVPKSSRAVPRLTLLSPSGEFADIGQTNAKSSRTARFSGTKLTESGVWRIGVDSTSGAGGAFTLAVRAQRVPLRFSWKGELADATDVAVHEVPAAPGRSMSVVVAAGRGSEFAPAVEVVAPSGAVVAVSSEPERRTRLVAPIEEAGLYTVRVSGGPGTFSATAKVRPSPRRKAVLGDVEAAPAIDSFTPDATTNQKIVTFALDGVGFTENQHVSVADGSTTLATSPVQSTDGLHAVAVIDLASVPPGTYSVLSTTPAGNRSSAAAPLVVTNRVPVVGAVTPMDLPAGRSASALIGGAGFDADAEVLIRRAEGGEPLPFTIAERVSHYGIDVTASPAAYLTGLYDVQVRDSDGATMTLAGGIDVVGPTEPSWVVDALPGGNPAYYLVADAAYDAAHGRILVAVSDIPKRVRLFLADTVARTLVDSVDIDAADFGAVNVTDASVEWDSVTGTFAVCLVDWSQGIVFARIVPDSNIHTIAAQGRLTGQATTYGTGCEATANPDDGGFVIVWDQYEPEKGTTINARRWSESGFDLGPHSFVFNDQYGAIGYPEVAWQSPGRFVYAWCGYTDDYSRFAVRGFVGDSRGEPIAAASPSVFASSAGWDFVVLPELARNPADGSMLLTFWYAAGPVWRPSCVRLGAGNAFPGTVLDLDLRLDELGAGIADVAWNEARNEYVVAVMDYDRRMVLFRINADGSGRPAPFPEKYEATWGALYGGATPGSLGFVRSVDESDDGAFVEATPVMRTVAAPLR